MRIDEISIQQGCIYKIRRVLEMDQSFLRFLKNRSIIILNVQNVFQYSTTGSAFDGGERTRCRRRAAWKEGIRSTGATKSTAAEELALVLGEVAEKS